MRDRRSSATQRRSRWRWVLVVGVIAVAGSSVLLCRSARRASIQVFSPDHVQGTPDTGLGEPEFSARDELRPRIAVRLREVASGFTRPIDARFVPGRDSVLVVLEKDGRAHWVTLEDDSRGRWLELDVLTVSEQGLLGIAFHPTFERDGRFYLNTTVKDAAGREVSEVSAWQAADPSKFPETSISRTGTLLQVEQPYQNHNAGDLHFGPDGYLYVGFGDGGHRDDPHGHGQNPETFLGAMLRIDVDTKGEDRPYGIPSDNPFLDRAGFQPEIWAYGLRNPWRYSFDSRGRLIVADVGQDQWEEIHIVHAGDNLGWDVFEGRHCFQNHERCNESGFVAPIHEYGHDEGSSITGGVVYTGRDIEELAGLYVFGDFISGRLWALALPDSPSTRQPAPVHALGKWTWQPVSMTRDAAGEVYIVDYGGGRILRLDGG